MALRHRVEVTEGAFEVRHAGGQRGLGVFSRAALPAGTVLFKEHPIVAMQHLNTTAHRAWSSATAASASWPDRGADPQPPRQRRPLVRLAAALAAAARLVRRPPAPRPVPGRLCAALLLRAVRGGQLRRAAPAAVSRRG
eukprot:CAMPEP_0182832930 /NCGR_PEP_ID=MMETSP0006_2-20121128/19995_1 /TAXON_ID=97485 /ORGANISM="Prymnesium parvum, Strain Texoma1" /LENGTH=138 /DNA_ID=CAMNT_0024960845 /DNA_START=213 /DNA_END=627 /DNA_ORIENTATION=+